MLPPKKQNTENNYMQTKNSSQSEQSYNCWRTRTRKFRATPAQHDRGHATKHDTETISLGSNRLRICTYASFEKVSFWGVPPNVSPDNLRLKQNPWNPSFTNFRVRFFAQSWSITFAPCLETMVKTSHSKSRPKEMFVLMRGNWLREPRKLDSREVSPLPFVNSLPNQPLRRLIQRITSSAHIYVFRHVEIA